MFVLATTHSRLKYEHLELALKYQALLAQWNDLVSKINAKGGQQFLNGEQKQLSKEDIKRLLMLCHPDKHGGKKIAEEMTQKLLRLRS